MVECLWVCICEYVRPCVVHTCTGACICVLPRSSGVCRTEWWSFSSSCRSLCSMCSALRVAGEGVWDRDPPGEWTGEALSEPGGETQGPTHTHSHTCILTYSHTDILAYSHTHILAYSHTHILGYWHTRILIYSDTGILASSHIGILTLTFAYVCKHACTLTLTALWTHQ